MEGKGRKKGGVCGGCKREGVRVESVRVERRACGLREEGEGRRGKGGLVQA